MMAPSSVEGASSISGRIMALAIPKSMILGIALPSARVTRMLEGFRSRWMTPLWWACWTPSQTMVKSASRSRSDRRWSSQWRSMGTPGTYSMAK